VTAPDPAAARAGDWRRAAYATALVASVVASALAADVHPSRLLGGGGAVTDVLGGFFAPDLSAGFLRRVARLGLDSLLIGMLGTALAIVLAIGLAIAATRFPRLENAPRASSTRHRARDAVRLAARAVLAFFRAVPEIIWAFLFVRIFGLGPAPAVFAIAVAFAGIIGKLFAEMLEAVDPGPARQLRAAGSGWLGVLLYGLLPQVRGQWVAYALFRLECAIRSASILGIVGAGGLGAEIDLSLRYFQYDKLATVLLAVLVYVVALELASARLRRAPTLWTVGLFVAGTFAGVALLDIPWAELAASKSWQQARAFLTGFTDPTSNGAFLARAVRLTFVTLAMAWSATLAAAAVAFVLAPLGARTFTFGSYLEDAPRSRRRAAGVALLLPARAVAQLTRTLPELVWALLFVVWVGPGPTAGALAIGAHTVGILCRLFGDVLEEAEPAPARALEAAGAGVIGRYVYGVLPQAVPRMLAFTLFRFEVNIRGAAMVGFVGAGGLGDAIHTAVSLFHMRDLAALLIVLFLLVVLVDGLGDRVRLALLARR
jgi:phosphonate transport system permease protein